MDLGSLNGTWLNGTRISKDGRFKSEWHSARKSPNKSPLCSPKSSNPQRLSPATFIWLPQVREGDVIAFGERDESPSVRVALLEEAGVPVHQLRTQLAFAVAEEAGKGHSSEARGAP